MYWYLLITSVILISSIVFYLKPNKKIIRIYLFFNYLLLLIFFAFRGDFTADYNNYKLIYNYYNKISSMNILFGFNIGQEKGYLLLNKVVQYLSGNFVILQFVLGAMFIYFYFSRIYKESLYIWLSVLLFVTIGQYYTSFNITRQIIAVSIIFNFSDYLYKKKLKKYIFLVCVAILFHKSSIIMIPFYFILNIKFDKKKLIIGSLLSIAIYFYLWEILDFVRLYFYSVYTNGRYGMSGYNYKNILLPLAILVFVLVNKKSFNSFNNKINMWVNSVYFYALFSFFGCKVMLLERISHFFMPYALLIIPYVIKNKKNKIIRIFYIGIIVILAVIFNYIVLNNSGYNPYYFIF